MTAVPTGLSPPSPRPAILAPSPDSPTAAPPIVSYADLHQLIGALRARFRALGLPPQAAVAIALPNSIQFVVTFLTTVTHRAVAAPLNPAYTQPEFDFYLRDLHAALLVGLPGAVERNDPAVRAARERGVAVGEIFFEASGGGSDRGGVSLIIRLPGSLRNVRAGSTAPSDDGPIASDEARLEDTALVLHTSGTTGRPKVVPLSHGNLSHSADTIARTYAMTQSDRTLLVMPLFHVHGLLSALLAPLYAGSSIILPLKFSAREFWSLFSKHGATWYTAVPTMHQILLRMPDPSPMPTVRFIRSCSSPLAPATLRELERRFGAPVLEAYAMTEASHQMTSNPLPSDGPAKPGTVGKPTGIELRVLDGDGRTVPRGTVG